MTINLRRVVLSALDAAIVTMMLAAGLAYIFRWPLVAIFAVVTLAKVL